MLDFPKEIRQETAKLIQFIIYNPILWDVQEARGYHPPPAIWTADETAIETGKFILLGKEDYYKDPFPLRMYDSEKKPIFRKEEIDSQVEYKWRMFENLSKIKDATNNLLICEVGRGIDIVIANYIKKWDSIICYDSNAKVLEKTQLYFSNQKNIIFIIKNSAFFEFDKIDKPTIIIGNDMHIHPREILSVENPNIKHIILEGELLR